MKDGVRMAAAGVLAVAAGGLAVLGTRALAADPLAAWVEYGAAFGQRWHDGQAELAGYRLTYPRYGAPREGTAVTIVVTEPFLAAARVKADGAGDFGALKLNLIEDFPTGVYDYNLMTSAFVATEPAVGRPAGAVTKVSFSAQEWCGHAYHQALFDAEQVRHSLHSYFEGEADRSGALAYPAGGFSEDALLLWARGLAGPRLAPGEAREVPLLRSLALARLRHLPLTWDRATLSWEAEPAEVTVPAGTFSADVLHADVSAEEGPARRWTFHVERDGARRVLRWTRDDGLRAELVASDRMKYWELHDLGEEAALERLGLRPRPPRTP